MAGIALLLFACFLLGVLAVHALSQLVSGVDMRGSFGVVGSRIGAPLIALLGWPAAVLVPLVPAVHALRLFGRLDRKADRSWLILIVGCMLLVPVGLALVLGAGRESSDLAGLWGHLVAYYFRQWFGLGGSWIVLLFAASVLTAATLSWNPLRVLVGPKPLRARTDAAPSELEPAPEELPGVSHALPRDEPEPLPWSEEPRAAATAGRRKKKTKAESSADRAGEIAAAIDASVLSEGVGGEIPADQLPPPDLLTPVPERNQEIGRRELDAMGVKLMDALGTFRVQGELVGRTTGPVVTQFEIEPAPGVKVRQFATLASDLALAMRAPSIRVVAPIPGKGAVGIEVPNPAAEIVAFRELIESRDFQGARAALPIALGKDLEGKPVIADLAKMPHLLIAGATGSGKSVCVNTLITSLVYRHTPRTLRFLMVDPKMVELSVYNTLPHLRHKVVTDNRDAAALLKWAVLEMQERYELLAANACRNIQDFNRRLQEGATLTLPKRPNVAFEDLTYRGSVLPYIVVVIDELADLMMTVQGEVETPLAMLAQKARAIGIHLILATQRPSVNVITGLIKANFPSRIAFRVASQVDSRTILDGIGAEALLGNGDMLFIPPGKSEPARLQGAFIASEDTERLLHWYEAMRAARRAAFEARGLAVDEPALAEPDILETVRRREAEEAAGSESEGEPEPGDRDKLFREAAEVVVQHRQGSTSLLQRRLKVGYGRAARIIDQLHTAGVLGPPDGSKPREVLVGLEELDRICGARE